MVQFFPPAERSLDRRGEIQFGTDGWRGIIAADVTFSNIRRVSSAIVSFLDQQSRKDRSVVIGYDNRFLSEEFALESAHVFIERGYDVVVSHCPIPTPALSLQVIKRSASLGIMITASHNPPQFNGLKLKTEHGMSALAATTDTIQKITLAMDDPCKKARTMHEVSREDFIRPYIENLKLHVDINRMKRSRRKLLVDSMHGTGGTIVENLLAGRTCSVNTIHSQRDPLFGGRNPEPLEKNLSRLASEVKKGCFDAGVATDGDADRVAAIADDGSYVSPLTMTPLLALHLIENKKRTGAIAKTFANTVYLDKIAAAYSFPFFLRPVGFKHVAELMLDGDFLIGGEESGGIGFGNYIPERDGILASLLLFEMICQQDCSLSTIRSRMWKRFGFFDYRREDIQCSPDQGIRFTSSLADDPPDKIGGYAIERIDTLDGVKFIFSDESWLLLRQSGTEPVLRLYAEATSKDKLDTLIEAGKKMVCGKL